MPPPPANFSGGRTGYGGTGEQASYGTRYGDTGLGRHYPGEKYGRSGQWYEMSGPMLQYSLVAWIVFTVTSLFCGFFYHNNETLIWIIVIVGGLITARVIYLSATRYFFPEEGSDAAFLVGRREQLNRILVSVWLLLSALCGFAVGLFAYELYIRKFFLSQELVIRQNVLPSEPAAAYANAGEIGFAEEARIDLRKTIGYQDIDVYCVAPIAGDVPLEKVQFWAAGVNCCGARGGFVCDDAWDLKARAGIVLQDNQHSRFVKDLRPYYMEAVKMAEATYAIASADEPVFVKWVADPDSVERNFAIKGFSTILGGIMLAILICGCMAYLVGSASNLEATVQQGYVQ